MMRVIDGARVLNGATNASDIPFASYDADITFNTTAFNMKEPGHDELIVNVMIGATDDGSMGVVVQESNEQNANFTSIPNAFANLSEPNKSGWIFVDWNHPDRKKWARLQAFTADGTVELSAATLRVRPHQEITADTGIVLV